MVVFTSTFVRHGETLYNRKKIIQGQTDIPLSQVGIQQAKMVAARLADESFTHVYSSDLSRAYHTAQTIMEGSKVCKCPIIKDKRLRERKFGVLEGKSSKEYISGAKKANVSLVNYTPPGAETSHQIQERASSFFEDLCKQMVTFVQEYEDADYTPRPVKLRHSASLGRNSGYIKNRHLSSQRSQSFCSVTSVNDPTDKEVQADFSSSEEKRRKFNEYLPQNDFDDEIKTCISSNSINFVYQDTQQIKTVDSSSEVDSLSSESTIGRSNSSSSSGYASLADSNDREGDEVTERDLESLGKIDSSDSLFAATDSDFSADIDRDCDGSTISSENILEPSASSPPLIRRVEGTQFCPNVSLSPLFAHRLSSVSSISSGRNSSFDDMDSVPASLAEVLVVSHGGLIKELIRHFVENLGCKIPGGKHHALKVCANCSLSKFTVTIQDASELPTINCIVVNDTDHLKDIEIIDVEHAL